MSNENDGLGTCYDSESDRGIFVEHSYGGGVHSYDFNTDDWEEMEDYPSDLDIGDHGVYYSIDIDACIFVDGENSGNDAYAYYLNNDTWVKLNDSPEDINLEDGAFYYDSESNRGVFIEENNQWEYEVYSHFEKFSEWSYESNDKMLNVAVSADGEYIAAGSYDEYLYFFEKDSNTVLWSSNIGYVFSVDMSADGEYIVAGSENEKVYLYEKDSSTPLWSYDTDDFVNAVAISADGEYIAVGGDNDKVYLFGKDSNEPIWSYDTGNDVDTVDISADGSYIVAGTTSYSGGGTKVYFFNKESNHPIWTRSSFAASVSISANGEYFALAGYEDTPNLLLVHIPSLASSEYS
jgi:WD40 repeat protein